eukprot:SAG31_NODE_2293_length_5994_cov_2.611535_2_plen_189_part_00
MECLIADPELKARMMRFASSGRSLDDRSLRLIDLNRTDLEEFAQEYKDQMKVAVKVREENNLARDTFVPEHLVSSFMVVRAVAKFKALASARRLRDREEQRVKAEDALATARMEGRTQEAQLAMLSASQKELQVVLAKELEKQRNEMARTIREEMQSQLQSLMSQEHAALKSMLRAELDRALRGADPG